MGLWFGLSFPYQRHSQRIWTRGGQFCLTICDFVIFIGVEKGVKGGDLGNEGVEALSIQYLGAENHLHQEELIPFQFFLKYLAIKISLGWVHATDKVFQLKQDIMHSYGNPAHLQHLIYKGKSMQYNRYLQEYKFISATTIILNLQLRGGAARSSTTKGIVGGAGPSLSKGTEPNQEHINGGISYKNILHGKSSTSVYT